MAENIKKQVAEDWQNAFPQLIKYGQNKYYKILGSVLVGIELVKPPSIEKYSPHFVIYSLWGNKAGKDLKACLSGPIALKPFYNKKGQEIYIPYNRHEAEFSEALKAVKNQLPFSMEGDVPLKEVMSALDEYSKTPPLSAAPNSYLQASLMESKLEMAICLGNEKLVQDIFSQIKKRSWDLDHFALWGLKYEEWLKGIENKITNKNEILSRLETNKQDKKLEKLQQSELN
ncbi:hypothetical protein [Zobellia galactanivorans]|uniref:hypothetical protein n=1 Tax=Zobellia galactanivorans (strain DSM 12802 / CCUG 47099 / CIP 106680 / NCIMB 13871 / Dsij) TaxID=63186 RepID=UPI001C07DD2A|nr:hypothetical protein [Zobellia galactanivorans]MBU3026759.1 hypothetical protein [Zobellia galactanivorans]